MKLKNSILVGILGLGMGLGLGCGSSSNNSNTKEPSPFYENAIVNVPDRYSGENILDNQSSIYISGNNVNSTSFEYVDALSSVSDSTPLTPIGNDKYEGNLVLRDGMILNYKVIVNYGNNKEKPTHNSSSIVTLSEQDAFDEMKSYLDSQNCIYNTNSSVDLGQLVEYDFYITEKDGVPINGFINYWGPDEDQANLESDKQFVYSLGPNYDYFLVIEKLGTNEPLTKQGLDKSLDDFYNSL